MARRVWRMIDYLIIYMTCAAVLAFIMTTLRFFTNSNYSNRYTGYQIWLITFIWPASLYFTFRDRFNYGSQKLLDGIIVGIVFSALLFIAIKLSV